MAKIAFFTLNAYDMLTGGHEGDTVGGAQVQQILVGKELVKRGHKVYFVEYNEENKKEKIIDGIEVITKPLPTGSELSRALTVIRGTKNVLNRINPDICYRRVLDFEILPLSIDCSLTGRRFVYGIAHDDELTNNPRMFSNGLKNTRIYQAINRLALSNADAVIAQNSTQRELAAQRLNTDIYQIPNCYVTKSIEPVDWQFEPPVIFWAASFRPWKRPELIPELATEVEEATFVMAGGPGDDELFRDVKHRSEELDNLHVLGHIPFSEIDSYFAASDLFLNTSEEEGFPNTFLQAWAQQVPVASLAVDPDNILSSKNIGIFANNSTSVLREGLFELSKNKEQRQKLGLKSQKYLRKNHAVDVITDKYQRVFLDSDDD